MIAVMRAGSAWFFVRENVTAPFVSVMSPALSVLSIFTPPLTPAAPSWIWPMLIAVVAGQPVIETSNFALVPANVTVAVPAQVASASVIGGVSFDAFSSAFNVFAGAGDGDGVGEAAGRGACPPAGPPPHAIT